MSRLLMHGNCEIIIVCFLNCYICGNLLHGLGLPWWLSCKQPACQRRRCGFDLWVKKIPWRRKWQPTPAFLSGKSHGRRSVAGYSPWSPKRVGYDLETEQQQHIVLSEFIGIKAAIWVYKQNPEKKIGAHVLELEVSKFKVFKILPDTEQDGSQGQWWYRAKR